RTLERLERAHTETVDWLMTRLAEVAAGGPAALRPTPLQSVVGFGRRLTTMPARNVSETLNRSIDGAGRARRQAAESVRTNGARVTTVDDVRAVIAYETANKARKGVLEAAQSRIDDLAARLAAVS